MARNLVICCDGTWDTPTQTDRGRVIPSNVVKMARAVLNKDHNQIVYYHTGVGTGKGLDKITGGALGIGLTHNIIQTYKFIADNYKENDTLYFFGFSRGAYTVRSLAAFISLCGLTPKGNQKAIDSAYKLYRGASDEKGKEAANNFKKEQRQPKIHFLGVWDTVGALGIPALSRYGLLRNVVRKITKGSRYAHGLHDRSLSSNVIHAYHALAIDEKRGAFQPTLWKKDANRQGDPYVKQVWFSGVHTNIGGGYVDTGLSDHAFIWMAVNAMNAGLVLDMRYLAMRVDPNCHGELRDSMTLMYRPLPKYIRQLGLESTLNEAVHESTLNRHKEQTDTYNPENPIRAIEKLPSDDDGIGLVEKFRLANVTTEFEQLR